MNKDEFVFSFDFSAALHIYKTIFLYSFIIWKNNIMLIYLLIINKKFIF